jgi:thiamine biosynthesis lipoprotein
VLLSPRDDAWTASFEAMAGPCEVLMEVRDRKVARRIGRIVAEEAWRVERKFSRYRDDNLVHAINNSGGEPVELDEETARLVEFADLLFRLSEGRFDVTSGVLRRVWHFNGSDAVPEPDAVERILKNVGWTRVRRTESTLALEPGMEIDLGGIGKEYAVDRAVGLVREDSRASCLVNFGGDLAISHERQDGIPWRVGIEDPDNPGMRRLLRVKRGALATSGDARRFLLKDGVRYGHILDATTGWPVSGAPRSVTIAAATCTEAGMAATLAMLRGPAAEGFLEAEGLPGWTVRD